MYIHQNFIGGNIRTVSVDGDTVYLENELRDTKDDWFYWAFCVQGAAGRTITFHLGKTRLGYWGPAVSHDLKSWHWLHRCEAESFTYTFAEDEDRVYFAHDMLYHPDRFYAFARERKLSLDTLCLSPRGREIPCFTFGEGSRTILLTARHHACESTGSYVLEGVLSSLMEQMPADTRIFCVPFVDFDGVIDGDQGKNRLPYDHNRDYALDVPAIHPSCAALREFIDREPILFGFDFHSPWHCRGRNDKCYIVQKDAGRLANLHRFSSIFAACMNDSAFTYDGANDLAPNQGDWNRDDTPTIVFRLLQNPSVQLAFSLETAYFGEKDNIFTAERGIAAGRCFAEAIRQYAAVSL